MTNNQTQREIKFRAWDIETETMEVVSGIFFYQEADEFGGVACVEYLDGDVGGRVVGGENGHKQSILMQYTGLKDSNGKEIYEGDILKDRNGNTGVVVWYQSNAEYLLVDMFEYLQGVRDEPTYIMEPIRTLNRSIGNIHENPELLSD